MAKRTLVVLICLALGLAAAPAYAQKSKDPVGLHGLEMRVREGDKPDFNDMTKKWGVEALRDENTGYLVYVSETGSLTVLDPGKPVTPAPADQAPKKPLWLHGLGLKARKAGESEWKDAKKWGLEAFRDENTGALLFMTEAVNLSALAFPTPPAPPL